MNFKKKMFKSIIFKFCLHYWINFLIFFSWSVILGIYTLDLKYLDQRCKKTNLLQFSSILFYFLVSLICYYLIIIPLTLTILALCKANKLDTFINTYILLNTFIFFVLIVLTSIISTIYFRNLNEIKYCNSLSIIIFVYLLFIYTYFGIVLICSFIFFIKKNLIYIEKKIESDIDEKLINNKEVEDKDHSNKNSEKSIKI